MSLEIYLVRHGQTQFNELGRIQGWCDSPLTEQGKSQAIAAGERLAAKNIRFDAAFCSISKRTMDTAALILQHSGQRDLPVHPLADLREYHFGSFEGGLAITLHDKIAKERGFASREEWINAYRQGHYNMLAESVCKIDPEQRAENESTFLARLHNGLHEVIAASPWDKDSVARVLVVSHGMAITAILKSIDPTATLYQSVPNASITQLRYSLLDGLQIINIAEQGLLGSKDRPIQTPPTSVAKTLAKAKLR